MSQSPSRHLHVACVVTVGLYVCVSRVPAGACAPHACQHLPAGVQPELAGRADSGMEGGGAVDHSRKGGCGQQGHGGRPERSAPADDLCPKQQRAGRLAAALT